MLSKDYKRGVIAFNAVSLVFKWDIADNMIDIELQNWNQSCLGDGCCALKQKHWVEPAAIRCLRCCCCLVCVSGGVLRRAFLDYRFAALQFVTRGRSDQGPDRMQRPSENENDDDEQMLL